MVGGLSGVIPIAPGVADLGNPLRKFDVLEDANRLVLGVPGASNSGLARFPILPAGDSGLETVFPSLESVFCKGIIENPPLVGDSGLPPFIVRGASLSVS